MSDHNIRMLGQSVRELAVAVKRLDDRSRQREKLLEEIRQELSAIRELLELEPGEDYVVFDADFEVMDDEDATPED